MNGHEYIIARQTEWAKNKGLNLIDSQKDRGRLIYISSLDDNLFQPLIPDARRAFLYGRQDLADSLSVDKAFGKKH
jgi:hypothetical protein